MRDTQGAAELYRAAIRQCACLVSAALGLGTVLQAQGRVGEAKQLFRRSVRRLLSYAAYHGAAVLKPSTLPTAHDPVLRFEPIIQVVSILSPTLFIQRIGQRCDGHDILPRYGLSVQRCLRFLDVLFLRVRVCFECSLLHLSPLLLFIPSPTIV